MAKEECRLSSARCYIPSILAMGTLAVVIGYGTFAMRGFDLSAIMPRHYVGGALLWFFLSPVLIGLARGARRSRRDLRQA